jgi:cellulose synthase/poly-beta-1,6-N-acetylglucosamine synthase-like glycosyltransferase
MPANYAMTSQYKKEKNRLDRFFQALPGLLTWLVLTSPLWLGKPLPLAVALFITFLTVFWVYRAFIHLMGMIIGYRRYKDEIKQDWLAKIQQLDPETVPMREDLPVNLDQIKNLIVVPLVNESEQVLTDLVEAVAQQTYPSKNIYLVFSVEERFHQQVKKTIQNISLNHPEVANMYLFVHPSGLDGEVRGAASNRTWGARNAVALFNQKGLNIRDFIITTMDGDAVLHPQYISR